MIVPTHAAYLTKENPTLTMLTGALCRKRRRVKQELVG